MDNLIKYLADNQTIVVFGVLIFFGLAELIFGYFKNSKRNKNDLFVESVNIVLLLFVTKPLIVLTGVLIISKLFPSLTNITAGIPLWSNVIIYILIDDLLQYWYHRSSHEYKWLWKWHRPHHTAEEMGLLVSYREAMWFYVFMPNIWWAGIFTGMGAGVAVAAGLVLKQIIVITSHSMITWDSFFYKRPKLMPVIKVLERIFITPAFHHGHHAVSIVDDIGHPNGNFGNMFSFWDQLFGSAKFTHAFPSDYGLPVDLKDDWKAHVFYPLVKSKIPGSEISKDYTFEKTTRMEPTEMVLAPGDYLYCNCGFSKNQPFCDGSHHGTKIRPTKFTIKKEREYKLCNCKLCAIGPFCDNTHLKFNKD
jgi:sterol desaturase/sphingolipid hydroxylase (fatty acid hydroxylase superfamily)/CDGSH-type Zn-finger protein